jgi:exopolysaccharide biosynthesis WecB/TagA/CpsF family protein
MEITVAGTTVRVNIPTQEALIREVEERLIANKGFALATLNLDHLVKLRSDVAFRDAYSRQDLITADGNPVVWLTKIAGCPVELVPGSDMIRPLLGVAAKLGAPVAFLGSTEASLRAAAGVLSEELPDLRIHTCVAPPMGFDPESREALQILDDLAAGGVRLVLLALGAPKQERLAAIGRSCHPEMGFVSVGAGIDFIAGRQRRAPKWVRRLALEWLWRMVSDPKRLAWRYVRCVSILPSHLTRALVQRLI